MVNFVSEKNNEYTLNHFIEKESLNSLSWCIMLVIALTEVFKICFPFIEPRILVLFFSIFTSYSKMYLNNGVTKENLKEKLLISFFNVAPIALGAIGSYDMVLKFIFKSLVAN